MTESLPPVLRARESLSRHDARVSSLRSGLDPLTYPSFVIHAGRFNSSELPSEIQLIQKKCLTSAIPLTIEATQYPGPGSYDIHSPDISSGGRFLRGERRLAMIFPV